MDFDGFYRDTSRRLLRYAYGLTGDPGEAQDLVQEAYARAWQRWRSVSGYEDPEAWLRLVVNRLSTDRWRRIGIRRARAAAEPPPAPVAPPSEDLVLTGAGLVTLRQHRNAEPILPATTPSRIRELAPLGEPVPPPAAETWNAARISGNRVIGPSRSTAVAVDTRTGKRLWTLPGLDDGYLGVVATATVVVLVRRTGPQPEGLKDGENRILEIHDAATGAARWTLPHNTRDRLVLHRDVLVSLTATTGRITAYVLDSGKPTAGSAGSSTTATP